MAPAEALRPREAGLLRQLVRSTAFKLTLGYLFVFGVFAGVALGYVEWNARRLIEQQIRLAIDTEINGLSEQLRIGGIRRLIGVIERRAAAPGASLYLVTNRFGERLVGNVQQVPAGLLDRPGEHVMPFARGEDGEAERQLAIVRVYVLPAGIRLLVGRDASESDRLRSVVRRASGWSLLLLLALGALGGLVIARRILRRVDSMGETARGIMAGDRIGITGRLAVAGNGDELDRLAVNLNAMLDRIDLLMQGLRQVSDNIAHDLKTPLTRLRNRADEALRAGRSESDLRRALEGITEDADNLISVFNALLMLARLEAGQLRETLEPFAASETAESVGELYAAVAEDAGGRLETRIEPDLHALGSRELIGQTLANLLDNALKYGVSLDGEGAEVTLSVAAEGEEIVFVVADRGSGIDEADRERALERFGRLDRSRSKPGFGLGLSLAKAVASIHKGSLELADNAPGLKVILRIPRAEAPVPPPAGAATGEPHERELQPG